MPIESMIKSDKQHKKYWEERKIDWKTAYFDTWTHPHRQLIINELRKMHFKSLLEIGCAAGPNLYLIHKNFPNTELGGIDINKDAIETARQIFSPKCVLEISDAEDLFFSDKSVDVILTDMLLIYFSRRKVKKVLREIKRVGRTYIVLVEFYSKSFLKRLRLKLTSGYNAHNYEELLTRFGFYDIEIKKIQEKDWPGGNPQKEFGFIITARL